MIWADTINAISVKRYRHSLFLLRFHVNTILKEKITGVQWIPLINLTLEEIIVRMQLAKVYVDFGEHPGKDRIPREAAVNGCCIITNRKGSAAFFEDVPIMEQYKFKEPLEKVEEIEALINDICENYAVHMKNFEEYRCWIKDEKRRFETEVLEFIKYWESKEVSYK